MTFILFCKKGDFAVVDWALLILMAGIFRIHSYFNTDIKYDFICHQKNRRVTYSIYCWFLIFEFQKSRFTLIRTYLSKNYVFYCHWNSFSQIVSRKRLVIKAKLTIFKLGKIHSMKSIYIFWRDYISIFESY